MAAYDHTDGDMILLRAVKLYLQVLSGSIPSLGAEKREDAEKLSKALDGLMYRIEQGNNGHGEYCAVPQMGAACPT